MTATQKYIPNKAMPQYITAALQLLIQG
ncbi:uncharacterized protein METZ01_LOCUS158240 [marine metagenome]|uniref:Uncharacterized protein n=1 Tax=marine metagenome TaxID=408172 RepID=A0A382AV32_9ZZZZ